MDYLTRGIYHCNFFARLPEMTKQIKELEGQVEALKKALDVRAAR